MGRNKFYKNNYILIISLLIIVSLSVGFSAFQKQLLVDDILFHVRLQRETRVSNVSVSSTNEAVSNSEEFNVNRLLGNVTFDNTNSYILYKVDLTNYGNVKTGLLNITNNGSDINYQICNSNAENCTNNFKTEVCNSSSCTLGSTKEIYLKVSSTSSGTKNIDLELDFEPYNDITYTNFHENTSSFSNEIMSNDTYSVTFTSKPEEVEVSGTAQVSYNKITGVLNISNVESDISLHAKYLINNIAQSSYNESNPNNYVRFNNSLFRIVTKDSVDDGYGTKELRTKIIKHESIGNNPYDIGEDSVGFSNNGYIKRVSDNGIITNIFKKSTLKDVLNNTYYNSLNNTAKDLIDTSYFLIDDDSEIVDEPLYFGLINNNDFNNNNSWLTYEGFTLNEDSESSNPGMAYGETDKDYKVQKMATIGTSSEKEYAVINGELQSIPVDSVLETRPTTYLKTDVLIVGGSGTSTDPYILELKSNSPVQNPTVITAKDLTFNGSAQELVTITNKVGTVYFSNEWIDGDNYTTGSTSTPTGVNAQLYSVYYYIPAGSGYKAKRGSLMIQIKGLHYTATLVKGQYVSNISDDSLSCTTSGSSTSCNINLPSFEVDNGGTAVGWTDGNNVYNVSTSLAISSNITLTTVATLEQNYQNTTTNEYYQTLSSAFSEVENNQTIKVLENTTETQNASLMTNITGIKLDLNGKAIQLNNNIFINQGELDIYNSSSNDGTIIGSAISVIQNNKNLSFNSTMSSNKVIISSTSTSATPTTIQNLANSTMTINNNVEVNANANMGNSITNYGILVINGGSFSRELKNNSAGNVTINNATFTRAIVNQGSLSISNITLSGSINNSGTLNMSGGVINGGTTNCIYNSGTAVITGGSFTSSAAIKQTTGSLTIGTNDSSVSITSPMIESTSSYSCYGVEINSGTFNFYDGIIKTSSGKNYAINKDPDNIPSNYYINKELNNDIESAYLLKYAMLMEGVSGNATTNYLRTAIAKQDIETITFTNSLGSHTVNGTDCFDVSLNEDESVLAWVVDSDSDGLYEMTIGANGKVFASSGKYLFYHLDNLTSINGFNNFDTSSATIMTGMFGYCSSLTTLDLRTFNTSNVTSMATMFANCTSLTTLDLSSFNTSNVTNMISLFYECSGLTSLNLSNFNTSEVTRMNNMFRGCSGLTTLNIASFNTSKVTTMNYMFENCSSLTTLDLSNFDTSNVESMGRMFNGCSSLTSLNISSFNTSNVTQMSAMFENCSSLTSLDLNNFNTSQVTNMSWMFYGCTNLTYLNVTSFDTSKVTNMHCMFYACANLSTLDISNFDTSLVTDMGYMFNRLWSIVTIYASDKFVTTNVTDSTYMFLHTEHLVGGQGTHFSGSHSDKSYARIDNLPDTPGYFTEVGTKVALFYYNSNTTSGSITVSKAFASCTPEVGTNSCTVSIPSEVTNSIGRYNSAYKGVSNSLKDMGSASLTISESKIFLANYSSPITNYYYNGTTYTSRTLYRNEFFYDYSSFGTRINTTNNSNENYTPEAGPNGSLWVGVSSDQDNVVEYDSVQAYANTDINTFYSVYRYDVNYEVGSNVESIGETSGTCNVYADTSSSLTCSVVLPSVTPSSGYESIGWNTTSGATTGTLEGENYTLNNNNITLYANAKEVKLLMEGANGSSTNNYLRTSIAKQDIETITFTNSLGSHTVNGTDCFDVSLNEDESVLAWVIDSDSDGLYEMTIGANGKVFASSGKNLFYYLDNLTSINGFSNFDTSNVTDMSYMFGVCHSLVTLDLSNFDTSNVTSMSSMFLNCSSLTTLDLSNFDTSNVTSMAAMFLNCSSLTSLNLSNFNTSNVTSMTSMFNGCSALTSLNLNSFNTSEVTKMDSMFAYCSNLTTLNLSNFNTSKVTTMYYMFHKCSSLTTLDLSHFNTSKVTTMSGMFNGCSGLTSLNVSSFDTTQVTNMYRMFEYCSSLTTLDLSSFSTPLLTNTNAMFHYCSSLTTIYVSNSFDISNVTNSTNMFNGSTSLVGGSGTVYDSNHVDITYAHIDGGVSDPGYFTYKAPANGVNNTGGMLSNMANELSSLIEQTTN